MVADCGGAPEGRGAGVRIRTVKPEFWGHPVMSKQPDEVRLAAIGILNVADDEGYFLADPALIRSDLWPFDEDSSRARRVLAQLSEVGWCEVREHTTHGKIGMVVNFAKHQRVDRPSASKLKGYFLDDHSTSPRRTLVERSCPDQGSGIREQGAGSGAPPAGLSVTFEQAMTYLSAVDPQPNPPYSADEIRRAVTALAVNGWMWGKGPVREPYSAVSTKIEDERSRARLVQQPRKKVYGPNI
jgi:hypothetical protein